MRRYIFYFSIALLAFGIGLFVVFNIYLGRKKSYLSIEEHSSNRIQPEKYVGAGFSSKNGNERLNDTVYVTKLYKATCNDQMLLLVWNELKNDQEFQQRAAEQFYREADCSRMLNIKRIDLNDDGQKEIIVQGNNTNLCQRDDCLVWIFEKRGSKYKQILKSWATNNSEFPNSISERGLRIRKAKFNSYRIITAIGGRAGLRIQRTYQFDGNYYQEKECLTFEYQIKGEQDVKTCNEKWKE